MSTSRELLQQALYALEVATTPLNKDRQEVLSAHKAIRKHLAKPAPEPVAFIYTFDECQEALMPDEVEPDNFKEHPEMYTALYTKDQL